MHSNSPLFTSLKAGVPRKVPNRGAATNPVRPVDTYLRAMTENEPIARHRFGQLIDEKDAQRPSYLSTAIHDTPVRRPGTLHDQRRQAKGHHVFPWSESQKRNTALVNSRAGTGNRTPDLFITSGLVPGASCGAIGRADQRKRRRGHGLHPSPRGLRDTPVTRQAARSACEADGVAADLMGHEDGRGNSCRPGTPREKRRDHAEPSTGCSRVAADGAHRGQGLVGLPAPDVLVVRPPAGG